MYRAYGPQLFKICILEGSQKNRCRFEKKSMRQPQSVKPRYNWNRFVKSGMNINKKILLNPNGHINLTDAIWAGRFVEPRILEVLPAAYERFKRHFSGDAETVEKLEQIIDRVKQKNDHKIEFYGISIKKIRPWFFIRIRDRRSKSLDERKVSKTFRFKPETVAILKNLKDQTGQSETAILENLIATKGC